MGDKLKVEAVVIFTIKVPLVVHKGDSIDEVIAEIRNEAEDMIHNATNGIINNETLPFVSSEIAELSCSDYEFLSRFQDEHKETAVYQGRPGFPAIIVNQKEEDLE